MAKQSTPPYGTTPGSDKGPQRLWSGWLLALALMLSLQPALAAGAAPQPVLLVDQYDDTYDPLFQHYASRFFGPFVDWRWFKAQAVAESMLNERAQSEAGAQGLMQLLPSTYQEVREGLTDWDDIHAPRSNIAAGLYYDRMLYRKWSGEFDGKDRFLLMLASYNAGFYRVRNAFRSIGKVRDWNDIKDHLPGETRAYVRRIQELMQPQPPAKPSLVAAADLPATP